MDEVVAAGSKPGIPGMACPLCSGVLHPGDKVEAWGDGYAHGACAMMARADRRRSLAVRAYIIVMMLTCAALIAWVAGRG